MKKLQRAQGFTLIEVIISILLLSMMAFSIIKITDQSTTTKMETIKEDNDFLKIYSALYTMQWDINHYFNPLAQENRLQVNRLMPNINASEEEKQSYAEFDRNLIAQFRINKRFSGITESGQLIPKLLRESNNTITFLSNGYRRKNLNDKKSVFSWISYTLEDPTAEDIEALKEKEQKQDVQAAKNLVRYIDVKDPFSSDPTTKDDLIPQVLMGKVVSIEWSYWDRRKKDFTLIENYQEDHQPITAFKIKIIHLDIYDQEQTVEKIFYTNYNEKDILRRISLSQTMNSQSLPGVAPGQGNPNDSQ